jgi:hypothetical protein
MTLLVKYARNLRSKVYGINVFAALAILYARYKDLQFHVEILHAQKYSFFGVKLHF